MGLVQWTIFFLLWIVPENQVKLFMPVDIKTNVTIFAAILDTVMYNYIFNYMFFVIADYMLHYGHHHC